MSWRLNRLQHIDPQFLGLQQHFFLILLGCSTGGLESPSPLLGAGSHCLELQLELNRLQLTQPSIAPGYIIVWHPPASLWASHLHWIQPIHGQGYILISSTGFTCFSIDSWVKSQHVTHIFRHNINVCRCKHIYMSKYGCRYSANLCVWVSILFEFFISVSLRSTYRVRKQNME